MDETSGAEKAVRAVLGYPASGEIKTTAGFPDAMPADRQRRCVRVAHVVVPDESEESDDTRTFHVLVGRAWMHMLARTGRPVGGPSSLIRCVCVEAVLRDYVARELAEGLGTEGRERFGERDADCVALHRRLEIDPLTLLTRFERPLYADARIHLPLGAVVEASGLRVDFGDETVPERLVAHAEGCSMPYPAKLVATKASEEVVGDVS
jgi:hypothetical protein